MNQSDNHILVDHETEPPTATSSPVMPTTLRPSPNSSLLDRWCWPLLIGISFLSLVLRFWGLDRFETFVFDEVYFAKFAQDYLTNTPLFDAHPPLGKYFIAIGIWLKGFNSFGYRWMNALFGSFIPLLAAGLAYRLSHRRSYVVLAALFVASDGLILVESRYALLNIYLLIFGLLGHYFLIAASQSSRQWRWLTLAGIFLGATISVKWSGLSFIMAIYSFWLLVAVVRAITERFSARFSLEKFHDLISASPLAGLSQLKLLPLLLWLPLIAALVYYLSWQPHMRINPTPGLAELHSEIYTFHKSYSNRPEIHAYCSPWFSWPLMLRPVAYYYQNDTATEPATIYDVHAMGNPMLSWLSTGAVIFSVGFLFLKLLKLLKYRKTNFREQISAGELYLLSYLLIGYSANLFSWAAVSRFTFLYHFIPASVFGFLTLAWWVDRLLASRHRNEQLAGKLIIFMIIGAFIFWLPIYLGLPLSPAGFRMRMWLTSWI